MSSSGEEYTEEDLDATWEELDGPTQQEILQANEAESWDEFEGEEKFAILDEEGALSEDAVYSEDSGEEEEEPPSEEELDTEFDELSEEEQQAILDEYEAESWDDLSYEEKQEALGYTSEDGTEEEQPEPPSEEELDAEWDELSEEEQQAILDEYEVDSWDELSYEEKLDALGYEQPPEPGDADMPTVEVDDLSIESELELIGENPAEVIVNGIEVPGATEITMSGEGMESQYLREIGAGGDSDQTDYGWEAPGDSGSGGDGSYEPRMSGNPTGGEEPPLHIEIRGRMSQPTSVQFVEMRDSDEVFDVDIRGTTYEDMELHDFTREISGDRPYSYSFRIEVVEWREVELMELDLSEYFGDGSSASGGQADSPTDGAADFQSGSPGDPEIYELGEGEQRDLYIGDGETARNALFDTTAEGAGLALYADGEDWTIRDVGWRGDDNRSGIIARGTGTIQNVYLGDGGDSGIVGELLWQVSISGVNLQNSNNGIYITEDGLDTLPG